MSLTSFQKIASLESIANATINFYSGEYSKRWTGIFNQDLSGNTIKLCTSSQESFVDVVDALYEKVISASKSGLSELVPLQLTNEKFGNEVEV